MLCISEDKFTPSITFQLKLSNKTIRTVVKYAIQI